MKTIAVSATNRAETGKGPNRRLRQEGLIPAIMYGPETEPVNLSVSEHEFLKAVSKLGDETVLFDLAVEGSETGSQLTMICEAQRDPVTDRFVHLDFKRLKADQVLDITVPLHSSGVPEGVRLGGALKQVHRRLKIRCVPTLVPSEFVVDVSGLLLNESFHASDMELEEGIEILMPGTETLFLVAVPRAMASAAIEAVAVEGEGEEGEEGEAAEGDAAPKE